MTSIRTTGRAHGEHRLGRARGHAAPARRGGGQRVVPRERPPDAHREASVQGDRRSPLGRRRQRDPDPGARRRSRATRSSTGTRPRSPSAVRARQSHPEAWCARCRSSTSPHRSAASRSATSWTWSTRVTCGCTGSTSPSATGRPLELTPEHDGRIVADIVAEWAKLYDHAFELELDGPAGGTYHVRHGWRTSADRRGRVRLHPLGRADPAPACSPYELPSLVNRTRTPQPRNGAHHGNDHHRDRRRDPPHLDVHPRRRHARSTSTSSSPTNRCCSTPGTAQLFPLVSAAVGRIIPVESLRWITFGHVEADECGSMNQWLDAAPQRAGRARHDRGDGVAERSRRPPAAGARRR